MSQPTKTDAAWTPDEPPASPNHLGIFDAEFERGHVPCDEPPGVEEREYAAWKAAGGKVRIPPHTGRPLARPAVYQLLDEEREHQLRKFGGRPHEVGGWVALMEEYVTRARAAWAGSTTDAEALANVRKAVAVGVACLEQHGG